MPESGDRAGVEEQPEPLAGFHFLRQERVHDAEVSLAGADELRVAFIDQPDVLAELRNLRSLLETRCFSGPPHSIASGAVAPATRVEATALV